ncbi:ATP synthase epsilon chain [Thermodesulfobacterium geofontis OPF15]|jgi:F-type H+-transporting ATPase subunit epsilon|uniref:ATP synthase epsilon chain n=1 Tax=Thermodesulfobacterium geofontis (strain OPF15) TaxID=795359 RepID=F8C3I5_THEGP|nr:F0F1 ATP synthase subunit epsilon [Thermodesulfobacterium geofontis]AEH23623.1 ATP synthase epsilon chain [Thermodesulfobacterium geofontis OPF15]
MAKILLEVVTPDRVVVSEEVDIVTAPGVEGEFGVLANHAPMIAAVKIGPLHYRVGDKEEWVAISGGFCEVSRNKITFLVEAAERAYEIDVERALRAKERAEKRIQAYLARTEEIDYARARAALQRALTRLYVAERAKRGVPR